MYICYIYILYISRTQMTTCFGWNSGLVLGGLPLKNRGHLGSRYRTLSNELDPVASSIFSQPCLAGLSKKLVDQQSSNVGTVDGSEIRRSPV